MKNEEKQRRREVSFDPRVQIVENDDVSHIYTEPLSTVGEEFLIDSKIESNDERSPHFVARSLLHSSTVATSLIDSVMSSLIDEIIQKEITAVNVNENENGQTLVHPNSEKEKRVVQHEDENGNTYYVDLHTGASAWSLEELVESEIEERRDEYGNIYYYNTHTGFSAWTYEEIIGSNDLIQLPEDVLEVKADDGVSKYFYDTITGHSAWTVKQILTIRQEQEQYYSLSSKFSSQKRTTDASTQTKLIVQAKSIQTEDSLIFVKSDRKKSISFQGIPTPALVLIFIIISSLLWGGGTGPPHLISSMLDSTIDFLHQSFQSLSLLLLSARAGASYSLTQILSYSLLFFVLSSYLRCIMENTSPLSSFSHLSVLLSSRSMLADRRIIL